MKLTDDDLLGLVKDERRQSIGFDHDATLSSEREKALNYFKGFMPDVPALPNRSKATSSDVADAIETILPDLVEIFTGDDVATFQPQGQEDEEQAQQETDYVNHVFFNQNPGFLILYTMFKDACLSKTGVVKFWWEEYEAKETFEGKSEEELAVAAQDGEISDLEEVIAEGYDGGMMGMEGMEGGFMPPRAFNFTLKETRGKLCVEAVPPEDFTVARDTVSLREATYCAMRSRPRAQDLIAQGVKKDIVEKLPPYTGGTASSQARDTVGEDEQNTGDSGHNLHIVEIVEHLIRVDAKGQGEPQLWKITTGDDEAVLIGKEEVDEINYAAITPFIITHRFYGESVADRLIEIQKINTALMRMALDGGYFALNQRMYVDELKCGATTVSDLLRNEPGVPVFGKGEGAVTPIQAGSLNFDPFTALEYFKTVAEQRTGVVRNAQGLNPDTLHDTAKGAMALMTAAQKRVRLIARIFAETGVKDMFLGIHALLRKHASKEAVARLRGKWVKVSPTQWSARNDMSIEIGLGSSGREHDLIVMGQIIGFQTQAIGMQGGIAGPLVTGDNIFAATKRYCERAGLRAPELYFSDPADPKMQQMMAQKAQQPDPKVQEAQAKLQIEQQKAQATQKLDEQKAMHSAQLEEAKAQAGLEQQREKAAMDAQVAREKHSLEMELKRQTTEAELQMRREQLVAEFELKRQQMAMDHEIKKKQAESSGVGQAIEAGGDPG